MTSAPVTLAWWGRRAVFRMMTPAFGAMGFILSAAGSASSASNAEPIILILTGCVSTLVAVGTLAYTIFYNEREHTERELADRRKRGR